MQSLAATSSSIACRGPPSAAAAQVAAQRHRCLRVQAEKGFNGGQGHKLPKQVKKSKRGKVASRPSPKLALEQLQAEQAAFETSQRQQKQKQGVAAQAAAEEEEEEEMYLGSSSSTISGGSSGHGGTVQYGNSDSVPEVVTNRMLKRVILFMGTPVFGGILLFPLFYWLKIKQAVDLPNWVAYVSSSLTFGGGLLGISYGIMSASWDPRQEGSLMGWTEFQANVPLLLDRFRKDRD